MSTRGDEVLDRSLAAIGGKGLFLKELELAMLRGEADCAVHSLKDVPMELEPGFALPAILERADPCRRLRQQPLRRHRRAAARRARRHLVAAPAGAAARAPPGPAAASTCAATSTRAWRKLDAGEYDAIVLACAGLQRLGFDARIRARLDAPRLAAGAGAGRDRDRMPRRRCRDARAVRGARRCADTRTCVEAERAMNRALHGSCHVPVAALRARCDGEHAARSRAWSASPPTAACVRAHATRDAATLPEGLGAGRSREQLLAQGARRAASTRRLDARGAPADRAAGVRRLSSTA